MRPVPVLAGITLLLTCALVRADPAPDELAVSAAEVEVRSGPSPKFYATGKLYRGQKVQVVRDREAPEGWLAIKPPPGSFSWIKSLFLKQVDAQTGVVVAGDVPVPVRVGSSVTNVPPSVEQVKLQRGTQVVILDKPLYADSGAWVPIQAPPQEVRYIPAEAVKAAPPVVTAVASKQPEAPAAAEAAPAADSEEARLRLRAKQAEKEGKTDEARELYKQVAKMTCDHDVRILCHNRLHYLEQAAQAKPDPQKAAAAGPAAVNTARPATVAAAAPAGQRGQTTSLYSNSAVPSVAAQWSSAGRLRMAAFQMDGKQVYVLENGQGQPLLYATAYPGVSLDPYIGRTVFLYGPQEYRSAGVVRTYYMTATHVHLIQ
jgi:hypothetical protein